MNEERTNGTKSGAERSLSDLFARARKDPRNLLLTRERATEIIHSEETTVLHRLTWRTSLSRRLLSSPIRIGVTLMTTSAFASIMAIAISQFTGSAPTTKTSHVAPPVVSMQPTQQHSETRVELVRPEHVAVLRSNPISPLQAPVRFDAIAATSDTLQPIELGADQLAQLGVSLDDDGAITVYETNTNGDKVHLESWRPDGGLDENLRVNPQTVRVKASRIVPHAVTLPDGYARMFSGGSDKQGFVNKWIGPPKALSYSNTHSISTNGSDKREWFESRVDTTNGAKNLFKQRLPEIPMPPPPPPPPSIRGAASSAGFVDVPESPEVPQKHYEIKSVAIAVDSNMHVAASDSTISGQFSATVGGNRVGNELRVQILRNGSGDSSVKRITIQRNAEPKIYLPLPKLVGAFDSSYESILVSSSPDSGRSTVTKQRMVFKYRAIPDSALPRLMSNGVINGEAISDGSILETDAVNTIINTPSGTDTAVANLLNSLSVVKPSETEATIRVASGVSIPTRSSVVNPSEQFEEWYRHSTGDTATFSSLIPIRVTNYNTPQHFTLIFWYDRTPEVLNLLPQSVVEKADARPKNVEISVYPNPTKGEANVHYVVKNGQPISINVVSLLGHKLIEGGKREDQHGDMTLNLSTLDPGVYLLIATLDNGEKAVERVVVTK